MKVHLHKKFFWDLGWGGFWCVLIFANMVSWQSKIVGVCLFFFLLASMAHKWRIVFAKAYGLKKKLMELNVISWLWPVALISLFSSVAIVFYKLSDQIIINILFLVWVVTIFIESCWRHMVHVVIEEMPDEDKFTVFSRPFWILPLGFFVLIGAFAAFFFASRFGDSTAWSPWQFINVRYLFWFFASTFLIGLSIFAHYRTRIILVLVVLLSLLQHLYLPLTHQMPWGGDVWRILAAENTLEHGDSIEPVLFGDVVEKSSVFGVEIPRVFLVPQKYTYGSLWGLSVVLSKTLHVSLLWLNRWLVPVIFSLAVPVLLFRIGFLLFNSRRRGLLLSWLSLLPFPMQVWGGMTLPVSLGYVFFFLALWLWMEHWKNSEQSHIRHHKFFAVTLSLLMLFGYVLHFLLIWSLVILRALWQKSNAFFRAILVTASLFVIPIIELVSHYGKFNAQLDFWKNTKQFIGQFSGWFYASMIRPHDIVNANLFFNHTPARAFVENIFLHWRWWIIPAMLFLWIISVIGLLVSRKRDNQMWPIVWILSSITFGGYIISWYFLDGDHLFARRLDLLFPILTLILFISGLEKILAYWYNKEYVLRWLTVVFVFVFSFFITATYASGPDVRVIDVQNEYNVAEYIWRSRDIADKSRCVLADTWTLLPLEAISNGAIVGGGFPMDYNFGQTERVALFEKFSKNPEASDLLAMKKLTNSNQCWFVGPMKDLSQSVVDTITRLVGVEPWQVNGTLVWLFH